LNIICIDKELAVSLSVYLLELVRCRSKSNVNDRNGEFQFIDTYAGSIGILSCVLY